MWEGARESQGERRWKHTDPYKRERESSTGNTWGHLHTFLPIVDFGLGSNRAGLMSHGESDCGPVLCQLSEEEEDEERKEEKQQEERGRNEREGGGEAAEKANATMFCYILQILHICPYHQPTFPVKCGG